MAEAITRFDYKVVTENLVGSEIEKMEDTGWVTRLVVPKYLSDTEMSKYLLIFEFIRVDNEDDL